MNLDKLTYAGNPANLADVADDARYRFVHGDIADAEAVAERDRRASTPWSTSPPRRHVDRSILEPAAFSDTDVVGTAVLLEAARERRGAPLRAGLDRRGLRLDRRRGASARPIPLSPRSPYSASKAGGDLLVLAYHRTYGLDAVITRGSNTYGPHQYPEKLIPLFVTNALEGEPAAGLRRRHAGARLDPRRRPLRGHLDRRSSAGEAGEVYNVGGGNELHEPRDHAPHPRRSPAATSP